jgi:L-fucose mutarotase
VIPLAEDVAHPAGYMRVCHMPDDHRTGAHEAVAALVIADGWTDAQIEGIERFAFYDKINGASLIIQSGEATAYGNAIFCKGVILN